MSSFADRIERLRVVRLLKETGTRWSELEGGTRAAALAHYALFSLFPALLLGVTVVGIVLGDDPAMRDRVLSPVAASMTPELKKLIDETLDAMQKSNSRGVAAVVAFVGLFWGVAGALSELDLALRKTFDVPPPNTDTTSAWIKSMLRERLSGLAIFLGFGALVVVSAGTDIALRVFERVSTVHWFTFWAVVHIAVSVSLQACALDLLFVSRSGKKLTFKSAFGGAVVTSIGFLALERLFAFYVSHLTSYSAYGVAGAVLGLATWITLACLLLLFGAQLTEVLGEKRGTNHAESRRIEWKLHGEPRVSR